MEPVHNYTEAMKHVMREITPISEYDFFVLLNHPDSTVFRFPVHYHPEYELQWVEHFEGVRTLGSSIEKVDAPELAFVGPNTYHAWHTGEGLRRTHLITIQFSKDLFGETFIDKNLFLPIKEMMDYSPNGILFSQETTRQIGPRLQAMANKRGFDSLLDFLSILYDLAVSPDKRIVCNDNHGGNLYEMQGRRIKTVCQYLQVNYHKKITVSEVASLINMTDSGFCHFFKKRTQKSFVDYLNDLRIGKASRLILDSSYTISEIAYECGFNNISNFNRIFKSKRGMTPSDFRQTSVLTTTVY